MQIRRSALKHGVTEAAIVHAVEFALYRDYDAYDTEPPKVLILGPDLAANILEVVGQFDDGELYIFHAMPARPQLLELLKP